MEAHRPACHPTPPQGQAWGHAQGGSLMRQLTVPTQSPVSATEGREGRQEAVSSTSRAPPPCLGGSVMHEAAWAGGGGVSCHLARPPCPDHCLHAAEGSHPHSGVSIGSGGGRPGAPEPWPQAPVRHSAWGGGPLSAQGGHSSLPTAQSRALALGLAVVPPNPGAGVRLRRLHNTPQAMLLLNVSLAVH